MGFEERVALNGDHNMIIKYRTNKVDNYLRVRDQLRAMVGKIDLTASRSNTLYQPFATIHF